MIKIWDDHWKRFFVLPDNPTLEVIIKEYEKQFPLECKAMIEEMNELRKTLYNEKGMSKEGLIRIGQKIPAMIFATARIWIDNDFWNKENLRKFASLCPYLCVGRI